MAPTLRSQQGLQFLGVPSVLLPLYVSGCTELSEHLASLSAEHDDSAAWLLSQNSRFRSS